MKYSIIVPIYNRPDEGRELLESLALQTYRDFELILVEDGSKYSCTEWVNRYGDKVDINYIVKPGTGRSDTRNVGLDAATGDYFVFFDSDCIIPPDYMEKLDTLLGENYVDCFGGPDAAHESFTDIQKAINYSMTSFLTTGGIRGGGMTMEKFVPRTFNMGFSRRVFETVGGFDVSIHYGEDMDVSSRIRKAGYSIELFRSVFVYHKRRVDFRRFFRQVYNFGYSRISTIYRLYPETLKAVHFLPSAFVVCSLSMVVLSGFFPIFVLPLLLYAAAVLIDSFIVNKNVKIAFLSVAACFVQLYGYGTGFLRAAYDKIISRKDFSKFGVR